MHRPHHLLLRMGKLAVLAILYCTGSLGNVGQTQAMQAPSDGLFFYLYPENKEAPYACLGKPLQGWFIVGTESKEPTPDDPLTPLVVSQIQVWSTPPLIGKLSKDSWPIKSAFASRRFSYTPTKSGDEHLIFSAMVLQNPDSILEKNIDLKAINCRFKISINGDFTNRQGGIVSTITYTGEGNLSLVQNDGDGSWSVVGRGTTSLVEYSDGTEGDMTCVTSSPGTGSGKFFVEGEADPSSSLKPVIHFTDILTGVGLTCTDKGNGKTGGGTIPTSGWLPNSAGNGVLWDLEFSPQGGEQTLPISAVNDNRWSTGGNSGSMTITITPETGK